MGVIKIGEQKVSASQSLPAGLSLGSTTLIWLPEKGFHAGRNYVSSHGKGGKHMQ